VGITGSIGKTTTKDILATVLACRYETEKAPQSFNNAIGVPLTIFRAGPETEVLVAELGANHPGEITRLAGVLAPTVGIIVSIAPVHLEGFGSLSGVIRAKGELAESLPPEGTLYLAGDVRGLEYFRARARCRLRLFGRGTETRGEVMSVSAEGVTFRVGDAGAFFLPGASRQHIGSAVGAIAVALDFGISPGEIREALLGFRMPPLRWEQEEVGGATFVLDCYNASPESVRSALEAATALAGGHRRLVTVIGDMRELGAASPCFHHDLGEVLADSAAASVYLFGEEVTATYEALRQRGFQGNAGVFQDREALAREVARTLSPGDVVLFKGSRRLRLEEVARKVKETATGNTHSWCCTLRANGG
jgi:UDP-N-acetylmuramoyl-tripeptide--D-alanyl-D-alanine ligase